MKLLRWIAVTTLSLVILSGCASNGVSVGSGEGTPYLATMTRGNQTLHLFGSFHTANKSIYPFPNYVLSRFDRANAVAFEISTEVEAYAMARYHSRNERLFMPNGQNIRTALSPSKVNTLVRYFGNATVDANYAPQYYSMLIDSLVDGRAGLLDAMGVDSYLENRAIRAQKPILGLETAQERKKLSSLSAGIELTSLKNRIESLEKYGINTLARSIPYSLAEWKSGYQRSELDNFVEEARKEHGDAWVQAMLFDRNRNMATRLAKNNAKYPVIFATVGASHLFGEQSMIDYLKGAGYTLTETFPQK